MDTVASPLDIPMSQARLRQLAEQLAVEYAGAVTPDRVLRLVLSTGRRLRLQGYNEDEVLRLTKASVRAEIVAWIGTAIARSRAR
ncbi:hypothetical protein ACIBL3_21945 [Kribbella sp. NPDC050124]|uniref:hypothetical protein n=1 Tax=Kribbella sp. NPDC050124 TaxID=3364114 RepID=UPI0037B8CFE4